MSEHSVVDAQQEMLDSLRAAMRRHSAIKGSPLAEDYSRLYAEPRGKLVRGMLTLKVVQMVSGDFRRGLSAASAVEMLHLSGMIVDDWMDAATIRRGLPTLAFRYGKSPAFAIARHLFYVSLATLASYRSASLLERTQLAVDAMVAGQRREGRSPRFAPWFHYRRCIAGKTAALFALACEAGAIVADAPRPLRRKARNFGYALGMAFQIVDDHLDYFGSETLGKAIGTDFFAGVRSAPLLLLARRSRGHARDVRALLGTPMRTRAQFEALRGEMLKQGVAEETLAVARSYTRRADRELAGFPEGSARTDLSELANSLVNRTL